MKKAIALALFLIVAACGLQTGSAEKNISFSSGSLGKVFLEEQNIDGERVLVIDFKSDKVPASGSEVDKMAEEIWSGVKPDADRRGFENALMKIRTPARDSVEGNANQYNGLLFEAEKIENGTWKLKKVN
jgi:hypothetical protein